MMFWELLCVCFFHISMGPLFFFRPMQKAKAFRPKSLVSMMTWSLGVIAISLSGALGVKGLCGKASSSVEIPMSSWTHRRRFHAFPWILGDAFEVITDHFNFLVYGVDLAVRSIRQSALIIRWFVSTDMVLAQLTENPAKKLILSDPWQVVSVWFCSVLVGLPPMSLCHDALLPRFRPATLLFSELVWSNDKQESSLGQDMFRCRLT